MNKILSSGLMLFIAFKLMGAEEDLQKGKFISKIVCKDDPSQSYALYLPSSYSPDKEWPIIYGFDAGARGAIPVQLFQNVAEEYGFIVVGSNNSQNGPWEPIKEAINSIWKDTHARFKIDARRCYTTGFSGGGRVACDMAVNKDPGEIAGVIACSGAFNGDPGKGMPFAFFGTAGTKDFNLPELMDDDNLLDELNIPNRVRIFEGGHDWPPKYLAGEAVEWMEIQAIKSKRRPADEKLVKKLFDNQIKLAESLEQEKEIWRAYTSYLEITKDFYGLTSLDLPRKKIEELGASSEVKDHFAKEQEKNKIKEEVLKFSNEITDAIKSHSITRDEISKRIEELKKKASSLNDQPRFVPTVLNSFFTTIQMHVSSLIQDKKYGDALPELELLDVVFPGNLNISYNLACLYALEKQKDKALKKFKEAVGQGFMDAEHIRKDSDLDSIRDEKPFKELMEYLDICRSLLQSLPKYPENRVETEKLFDDLKQKVKALDEGEEAKMFSNKPRQIIESVHQNCRMLVQERKYKQVIPYLELIDKTFPGSPVISYDLATIYCIDGQNGKAVESLKKAVSLGFKDIEQIKKENKFDPIRNNPDFKKIIESLESAPK